MEKFSKNGKGRHIIGLCSSATLDQAIPVLCRFIGNLIDVPRGLLLTIFIVCGITNSLIYPMKREYGLIAHKRLIVNIVLIGIDVVAEDYNGFHYFLSNLFAAEFIIFVGGKLPRPPIIEQQYMLYMFQKIIRLSDGTLRKQLRNSLRVFQGQLEQFIRVVCPSG